MSTRQRDTEKRMVQLIIPSMVKVKANLLATVLIDISLIRETVSFSRDHKVLIKGSSCSIGYRTAYEILSNHTVPDKLFFNNNSTYTEVLQASVFDKYGIFLTSHKTNKSDLHGCFHLHADADTPIYKPATSTKGKGK